MLTSTSVLFTALAYHVAMLGNLESACDFEQKLLISFSIVNHLILADLSLRNSCISNETAIVFS